MSTRTARARNARRVPTRKARSRAAIVTLEDMMNVGAATAGDLRSLGIRRPADLRGKDPLALYRQLCANTGTRQDPCVLDVFIALVRFAGGQAQRPWWKYTAERKRTYGEL